MLCPLQTEITPVRAGLGWWQHCHLEMGHNGGKVAGSDINEFAHETIFPLIRNLRCSGMI